MLAELRRLCAEEEDSFREALLPWCCAGLHGGYRGAEWLQKTGKTKLGTHDMTPLDPFKQEQPRPKAFIPDDITFFAKGRQRISHSNAIANEGKVLYVQIRHGWQKNGNNGEKKIMKKNFLRPDCCPVNAWLDIVKRHRTNVGKRQLQEPLAVYFDKAHREVRYITVDKVEREFRDLARRVYGITKPSELKAFSCHSLRIGACNMLYSAGVKTHEIQKILRWNSNCWQRYLRDLSCFNDNVTDAVVKANEIPNIIT